MNPIEGSLTKEFPLSTLEGALAHVRGDLELSVHRRMVGDVSAIVTKRFLVVERDRFVYDRFLSLIQSEGMGSPRMRKIMYGIWALRDPRLQGFVLTRICAPDGTWRFAEAINKANAAFFPNTLESQMKARSNIERFFSETGILNLSTQTVHLDLSDGWLEEAVYASASLETSAAKQREMLTDPYSFIIANGLHGLANITKTDLLLLKPSIPSAVSEASDAEISIRSATALNAQPWNRTPPTSGSSAPITVIIDAVARERATAAHYQLERQLVDCANRNNLVAQYNLHIDLLIASTGSTILIEIKSCHKDNVHLQVRRGISQLLEYAFVYRNELAAPVIKMLVIESPLPPTFGWLADYLADLGIFLAWRVEGAANFATSHNLPPPALALFAP
jgi:hypothetical protein